MSFGFDESYYLSKNPDVVAAIARGQFASGYDHFVKAGAAELRNPNGFFNAQEYAAANPDVLSAVSRHDFPSLWDHYIRFGVAEGRAPSAALASFDAAAYLAANADVAAAVKAGTIKSAMEHFLAFGAQEGRSPLGADGQPLPGGNGSGQNFTLTENIETVTGFDSNDTIYAPTKWTGFGQNNTLQSGDIVNGGKGVDKLIVETTTTGIAATLKGVESLKVTSFGNTAYEASNWDSALKSISVENSVATTKFQGLTSLVDVAVKNVSGANTVTVGYTEKALEGNTVQKLELNNLTMKSAGGQILFDDTNGAGKIEQLDITVTGASDIAGIADSGGAGNVLSDLATINVVASAAADLGTIAAAKLTKFDASTSTAAVKADLSLAASNDLTILGGKGDDVITFGAASNLTSKDTIDLGDGNDTLKITGSATATTYNVKGVETLQVTTAGATTVNAQAFGTGVSTVAFVSAANGDAATVNNLADKAVVSVTDTKDDLKINALASLTVNGANTSGSADEVTVKLASADAGTPSAKSEFTVGTLTAAGYETINIDSTGAADTKNTITNLTATSLKTLNVTGDKLLTISSSVIAATVDASKATGGVDMLLSGNAVTGAKQTVTGGTGNDTFRFEIGTLDKDQKVNAGEGVDTLVLKDGVAGGAAIDLTGVTNSEKISGLSGFENLSFTGETLLIDDATVNRFTAKTINVVEKGALATGLDASKVLASDTVINVDASDMTGGGFTYSLSNGHDTFKGSAQIDTVTVTNGVLLSSSDVLTGGTGDNNVLVFNTLGADKQVISASQLTGVTGFSTIGILNGDATANQFELTLSNAFVANNINQTNNTLLINAGFGVGLNTQDKITIDASDVSGSYKLDVSTGAGVGAAAANTIKLGAGDDTVTLNSAVNGATVNTITLGGGKDAVVFTTNTASAAGTIASNNTIKDIALGATTTAVDTINLKAFNIADAVVGGTFDTVVRNFGAGAADASNVIILSDKAYDTAAAIDAAVATQSTVVGKVAVFWQDSLGTVHMGIDDNGSAVNIVVAGNDIHGVANFEGVTIAGVVSSLNASDLILV